MVDKIEENSQDLLFVYFQFLEIWNIIIISAKWIFRLLKYLANFTKIF